VTAPGDGVLACPLCRHPLVEVERRTFGCDEGHRFDRAREGHVNLLRPGKARKARSGDDREMVLARRAIIGAGRYRVLAAGLREVVDLLQPTTVLDVGCGEGSFTAALTAADRTVVAFDLSVEAVRLAARLLGDHATCVVAGVGDIPALDRSCDVVTSVMSPVHEAEFLRVARPGGRIVVVTPGADHLDGLRRTLYRDYRPHDEDVPLAARLEVVDVVRCREPILLQGEDVERVWGMTPYRWNAPEEGVERLRALDELAVTVSFVVTTLAVPV
jgi:23S rRNA (guanine745-N1)-methyltransferase